MAYLLLIKGFNIENSSPAKHAPDDVLLSKDGRPKVEGAFPLTKPRARNDADTGGLQQSKGIECISCHACLLGGSNRLLGQVDLRESVHGPHHGIARNPLDRVEGLCHKLGSLSKRLQDSVNLSLPAGEAWISLSWWVHHNIHTSLTNHCGTQLEGGTVSELEKQKSNRKTLAEMLF